MTRFSFSLPFFSFSFFASLFLTRACVGGRLGQLDRRDGGKRSIQQDIARRARLVFSMEVEGGRFWKPARTKENNGEEESEVGRTGKGWKRFPELEGRGMNRVFQVPGEIVGGYSS